MTHYLHLLPIVITGIFAATIIMERAMALFFRYSMDSKHFMGQIEALLARGNVQGALDLCASNSKALIANVVKTALLRATRDESEIKMSVEVALIEASGLVSRRIGYLAMIANVATLFGLLGTIAGLISSFEAVASADAATKQSLLASGISVSMNATALGLVVAIPTMIAFSVLNSRSNRIMDELEKAAGRVIALLHGRAYATEDDDLSSLSFEGVAEAQKQPQAAENVQALPARKLKGAA